MCESWIDNIDDRDQSREGGRKEGTAADKDGPRPLPGSRRGGCSCACCNGSCLPASSAETAGRVRLSGWAEPRRRRLLLPRQAGQWGGAGRREAPPSRAAQPAAPNAGGAKRAQPKSAGAARAVCSGEAGSGGGSSRGAAALSLPLRPPPGAGSPGPPRPLLPPCLRCASCRRGALVFSCGFLAFPPGLRGTRRGSRCLLPSWERLLGPTWSWWIWSWTRR